MQLFHMCEAFSPIKLGSNDLWGALRSAMLDKKVNSTFLFMVETESSFKKCFREFHILEFANTY